MVSPFDLYPTSIYNDKGSEVRETFQRGKYDRGSLLLRLASDEVFWRLFRKEHVVDLIRDIKII